MQLLLGRGRNIYRVSLQWRRNERDDVSNHRRLDCLHDPLFRRRWKKTSKLRVTGLCVGNSPVNSPHKKPVTWKMFIFDDVIMWCTAWSTFSRDDSWPHSPMHDRPLRYVLILFPKWISNYIQCMWDEITYSFPKFNGATVEVWEWISNFIPHFTGRMITYSCWALS